jgi:hypothetical protein
MGGSLAKRIESEDGTGRGKLTVDELNSALR